MYYFWCAYAETLQTYGFFVHKEYGIVTTCWKKNMWRTFSYSNLSIYWVEEHVPLL